MSFNVLLNLKDIETEFQSNEDFASLLDSSTTEGKKAEGSVVEGIVMEVANGKVTVDVGLKTEGVISLEEFKVDGVIPAIKAGDKVEVYIKRLESGYGTTQLSRIEAVREKSWERFEELYKKGEYVDGEITGRVRGGFTVELSGVVAFLPGSQVDIRPVKDISPLMHVKQPFQILKMDRKQGNIVVSRRAIMEESRSEARDELLSKVKEGVVLEGIVKNITDYGAFVDLGSIDGLLHVTDISWSRVNHPSEVLALGQTIKVQVIKFNEENKRISLGMKQLEKNPWGEIGNKFPVGTRCKGVVTNITDYGAFVELASGIEGLVHVSEISWTKSNAHPRKLLTTGQEVEVVVLDVDPDKHRISLGMKQCEENPWNEFSTKHPVGFTLDGEIKNVVEFGLFIGLMGDVDGLVHISDLTWEEDKSAEELKKYEKGQTITVKVLGIDPEKSRISLGIKQLASDPFEENLSKFDKGSVVTCEVTKVQDDGIEVNVVGAGISSFIKRSDLSQERIEQRPDRFAVGDKVDAKVISLVKKTRKISLSIKALESDAQKQAIKEYGSADSGASLGDILGAALGQASPEKPAKKSAAKKKAAE